MQYAPAHTKEINMLGLVLLIIEVAIIEFLTAKVFPLEILLIYTVNSDCTIR